jgi:membrane protein implicated in regulation of membrane protease activity
MAVREDVVVTDRGAGRGTTLLTWAALIVALLALWLAWAAYDRTGGDLDQRIQEQVQQTSQDAQEGAGAIEEAVDAGPDGVDEDDTDTTAPTDTTTEQTPTDTPQ